MNQFPWMVLILIDDEHLCGGSLISEKWILTSAHCTFKKKRFKVMAGIQNFKDFSEPHRVVVDTTSAFTHPDFDTPQRFDNDIALIDISANPVTFNDYVKPVCLPTFVDEANDFSGVNVTLTGWGKLKDDERTTELHFARNVPIMSNRDCQARMPPNVTIFGHMMCTESMDNKSSCSGDSGGPVNYQKDVGGPYKIIGVTSFHIGKSCVSKYPHVITRVPYFLSWIKEITGMDIDA